MPKAAHDWDVCANCSHTMNIHLDKKRELSKCKAYGCECEEYVKK